MYKYFTKQFGTENLGAIDSWLDSFTNRTSSERGCEIVGYVVISNSIVITIKAFDIKGFEGSY